MTATDHATDREILGRGHANDLEAIMDISRFNDDVTSVIHAVEDNADAIFTWDYGKGERAQLDKLYEKAKTSQWNATTDLDWSIEVDPYTALNLQEEMAGGSVLTDDPTSPVASWGDDEWREFGHQSLIT